MSEIRVSTLSDAAGTGPATLTDQWATRALLNYDHTGPTVDMSENVSSVTDVGTGNGETNFTNNFAAADYAMPGGTRDPNDNATLGSFYMTGNLSDTYTTAVHEWRVGDAANSAFDTSQVVISYFGDLA